MTHHLALHTTDDAAAQSLLAGRGIAAEPRGDRLILPVLADADAARATDALYSAGLSVLRLEERQKSLEDIFLELTGGAASL